MSQNLKKTQVLAESAMMVALSLAVFIASEFIPWPYAYGGGFSLFGQVPIILVSYRHGIRNGLAASTALAIFEMIMGYRNFTYVTGIAAYLIVALADYLIAFGCLGLGGMFRDKFGGRQATEFALGGAVVCIVRFICHFISGITVWKGYCPNGMAVMWYSFIYNGSYMAIELILTVIGLIAVDKIFNLRKKNLLK
ncbi:MAG: energy-coupled thiamine transporter ThiT [Acutalibacteraceae bacterium]|nr:energy-coupled thiamine transporter ThiT [Acutalibacteraceae bacterium]